MADDPSTHGNMMDRNELATGVYQRLQQEAAEHTRERATQTDEVTRRYAGRSQVERNLLLKLLRVP